MYTKDLIIYLEQLKKYLNEKGVKKAGYAYGGEPVTYTSEPIDEIIKRLKMWEEFKFKRGDTYAILEQPDKGTIRDDMEEFEQKMEVII